MKKTFAALVIVAVLAGVAVPLLVQADTASACYYEGLTPGYWKNHVGAWSGYTTGQRFDDVFGVTGHGSLTLLQALQRGGGKFIALDRQAVAALLNARSPFVDYQYTEAQVKTMVQRAYLTGNWWSAKSALESANQLGVAGS